MPGLFGAAGARSRELATCCFVDVLDPAGVGPPAVWSGPNVLVCHSRPSHAPVSDAVLARDGFRGWFAGDLPGHRTVPWDLILAAVRDGETRRLGELNGPFAVALHEEAGGRTWLISDRRCQQPLFFAESDRLLLFSTAAAAFLRLPRPPAFSEEWLFEYLFFNYPVLETSFLCGVRRVPPASVLTWDPVEGSARLESYAPPFGRPDRLAEGPDGLGLAREVFAQAAADCFDAPLPMAVALTAGFDSRTVLGYAPPPGSADLLTFTYGIPGSYDLVEAGRVAKRLGLPHLAIPFDGDVVAKLRGRIHETVRLSDGLERVLRATLPHVFATLRGCGRPVAVTGVSGDHLFRDHIRGNGNVPSLISRNMMAHIQGHGDGLRDPFYREALGRRHDSFVTHLRRRLSELEERHGSVRRPEGYLRYLVYESAPKYFGGEAALAGSWITYRTPYWDSRVVSMAFAVAQGTLGLSERLPGKDSFLECALQGDLIRKSPHYSGAPIKGISTATYARSSRLLFLLERLLRKGPGRLVRLGRKRSAPPLEDWQGWFAGVLAGEIHRLLGPEARLAAYLQPEALASAMQGGDLHWTGKLVTAEVLLRLIENGWCVEGAAYGDSIDDA